MSQPNRLGGRVLIAAIIVAVALPLVPMAVWAISGTWRFPDVIPQRFTTRGVRLIGASEVLTALGTSVLISTSVAVLACLIGLSAGRAIGLYRFRGRRVVQFMLLAPVIVPPLAVTLGIQVFFVRYGLADTIAGVVLVQLMPTVPYAALLLGAAYANYDIDFERQARSLGADRLRVFWHITLPGLRPALITAAVLTFLISWSEYVLTLLIGGGTVTTVPLLLFSAIGTSDRTAAAALGLVVVLPPVLAALALTRLVRARSGAGPVLVEVR